jgi:carbonic anhydrase
MDSRSTGYDEQTLADLPVLDPPATVRTDVERALSDPRISPRITVSGHVYDVHTGLITTIVEPLSPTASAAALAG